MSETTEVTDMDIAMGMLTLEQAAERLSLGFTRGSDSILLTKRLTARGSLSLMVIAGQPRIDIDVLRKFLRDGAETAPGRVAMKLPQETLSPIFPLRGFWFDNTWQWEISNFEAALTAEVNRQLQLIKAARTMAVQRAASERQFNKNYVLPEQPTTLAAAMTPELLKIIATPIPVGNLVFPKPDASAFRGLAEMFLAAKLQLNAQGELRKRSQANPAQLLPDGAAAFYDSREAYHSVVDAALASFGATAAAFAGDWFIQDDPTNSPVQCPMVRVTMTLPHAALAQAVGTDSARLACLAF